MNVWKTIYRVSWIILTVLIFTGVFCIFGPKFNSLRKMQQDKNELRSENQKLQAAIEDLRYKQERFTSDPKYVERTAKTIGMIRTNEVLFLDDSGEKTR